MTAGSFISGLLKVMGQMLFLPHRCRFLQKEALSDNPGRLMLIKSREALARFCSDCSPPTRTCVTPLPLEDALLRLGNYVGRSGRVHIQPE